MRAAGRIGPNHPTAVTRKDPGRIGGEQQRRDLREGGERHYRFRPGAHAIGVTPAPLMVNTPLWQRLGGRPALHARLAADSLGLVNVALCGAKKCCSAQKPFLYEPRQVLSVGRIEMPARPVRAAKNAVQTAQKAAAEQTNVTERAARSAARYAQEATDAQAEAAEEITRNAAQSARAFADAAFTAPSFEVPEVFRSVAEQGLTQTREAYGRMK